MYQTAGLPLDGIAGMNEARQPMLDFTSSLYLGLSHSSQSLRPWQQLTLGMPAALRTPPGTSHLELELARLQGCERVSLGTSTLHLFWDLFGMLSDQDYTVYFDQRTYPVARWGWNEPAHAAPMRPRSVIWTANRYAGRFHEMTGAEGVH